MIYQKYDLQGGKDDKMTLDKMTLKAQDAVGRARELASEYGNQQIEPVHIMLALVSDKDGLIPTIMKKAGLNMQVVETSLTHEVERLPKVQGGGVTQLYFSSQSQKMLTHSC